LKIDRIQAAPKEIVSVKPQTNEENNQDRKEQFLPFEVKSSKGLYLTIHMN
jgi:hypothetical protein